MLTVIRADEELPVAFYSWKLLLRERRYAATELEALKDSLVISISYVLDLEKASVPQTNSPARTYKYL